MKRMVLISGIVAAAIMAVLLYVPAHAELPSSVRLVLVQAAGADLKFERIDIQNLTDEPIDVTGWKVVYKSATGGTTTPLLQLTAEPGWHLMLDAGKRETFASKELVATSSPDSALRLAEQFTGGMSHSGGGVCRLGNGKCGCVGRMYCS